LQDEPTKQSFSRETDPGNIKKPNKREGHTELPRPQREEDLIIDEKKSKSTSL